MFFVFFIHVARCFLKLTVLNVELHLQTFTASLATTISHCMHGTCKESMHFIAIFSTIMVCEVSAERNQHPHIFATMHAPITKQPITAAWRCNWLLCNGCMHGSTSVTIHLYSFGNKTRHITKIFELWLCVLSGSCSMHLNAFHKIHCKIAKKTPGYQNTCYHVVGRLLLSKYIQQEGGPDYAGVQALYSHV